MHLDGCWFKSVNGGFPLFYSSVAHFLFSLFFSAPGGLSPCFTTLDHGTSLAKLESLTFHIHAKISLLMLLVPVVCISTKQSLFDLIQNYLSNSILITEQNSRDCELLLHHLV